MRSKRISTNGAALTFIAQMSLPTPTRTAEVNNAPHVFFRLGDHIMSMVTSSGGVPFDFLHFCFVENKFYAAHLKAGANLAVWFGSRKPRPFGFRRVELGAAVTSATIEQVLRLAPDDPPPYEDLEQTGRTGFFLADYPAIVYAEKRDGEIELFIHREPESYSADEEE
jgi:hypothetical protein